MISLLSGFIMTYPDLKEVPRNFKNQVKSYNEISSILGILRYYAIHLVVYRHKVQKKKPDSKPKINKESAISIKREILRLMQNQEKVNSAKIRKNCGLTISTSTTHRHPKSLNAIYKIVDAK